MKHFVNIRTRLDATPEEAERDLEFGRRQMGNELYKILYSQKLPAVVDIEEISIPLQRGEWRPYHELRIVVTVTPVQHRHVKFIHANLDDLKLKHNKTPILRRITNLFKRLSG